MKIFDQSGNVVDAPGDPVFNDLTKAPVIETFAGSDVPYVAIILRAPNGMFRIGLMPPGQFAKATDMDQFEQGIDQSMAQFANSVNQVIGAKAAGQDLSAAVQRIAAIENWSVPVPATMTPNQIALQSSKGVSTKYATEDHTHAARVQRKIVTLDSNGLATWTFNRAFEENNKPSLTWLVFQATGNPIIIEAVSWVREVMTPTPSGKYLGVNVRGYRSRPLPVIDLLTGLLNLTGVNGLITALTGFNVFGGGALSGVEVHLSAGDQL